MRKGGGKSKGASFERDICRRLSLWISNGQQEDVYWRSAMSGGRSTVAFKSRGLKLAAQSGDLSCLEAIGAAFAKTFFVEMKFYKDLKYASLLTGKGHLADFWRIAVIEAKRYDKLPLLIAKQNQLPVTVCLSRMGVVQLGLEMHQVLIVPPLDMRVVLFDTYLKYADRINRHAADPIPGQVDRPQS